MSTTESSASTPIETPLRFTSLCEAFQNAVAEHPERLALQLPDGSGQVTWAEYGERVRATAEGLAALGVTHGDTVAIQLTNRPEFSIVDTAVLHLGAAPFSVYNTNPADLTAALLENSGAKVIVTEEVFLKTVQGAVDKVPAVETLVTVDGSGGTHSLADVEALDAPDGFDFEASWRNVGRDDLVTLVYTSGTTGLPKGVQHTHHGILFAMDSLNHLVPVSPGGRLVSYLPMAHIAERYISHYGGMAFGYSVTCVPDPTQLPPALAGTKPTRLFCVPRILEKLRAALLAGISAEADPEKKKAVEGALELGLEKVRIEQRGETPSDEMLAQYAKADEMVFSKFRAKLGLDELEYLAVAAAPTPLVVLEFFHAIGLRALELWGMSEVLLCTSNYPDLVKLGSVGKPMPEIECKLEEDGELCVRGPNVMVGYRKDPERTAEAIDADGWMHSGDIAKVDEDGYYWIVDRKKELIINAAGKNMSPANIEMTVKSECPLIAQVVAIGDSRQYVTGLIVLDPEACAPFAQKAGISASTPEEYAAAPEIRAEIDAAVQRANEKLARVEQLKSHSILPVAWVPGGDELTPTMKLKRKPIAEKYSDEIEALYA